MSDIKEIDKREFVRNASKYIKQAGVYKLVGRDGFLMIKVGVSGEDIDVGLGGSVGRFSEEDVGIKASQEVDEYKCGCKRVDKRILCPQHSRY